MLDPEEGIKAGRVDFQCQGLTIEKGKIRDEADRGLKAVRKIRDEADHGPEADRLLIHSVRTGTITNNGGAERDPGKEVETYPTAKPRGQWDSTVQWRH